MRECQGLGIGDSHQQRPGKSRAAGNGDCVKVGESTLSLGQRSSNHRNNGTKMLAAGQFGHHSAITRVCRDLRGHHGRKRAYPTFDDSRRRLVT